MSNYLLREVTHEKWVTLPVEVSYAVTGEDNKTNFYEIVGRVGD